MATPSFGSSHRCSRTQSATNPRRAIQSFMTRSSLWSRRWGRRSFGPEIPKPRGPLRVGVGVGLRRLFATAAAVGLRNVAEDLLDVGATARERRAMASGTLDSATHHTPPASRVCATLRRCSSSLDGRLEGSAGRAQARRSPARSFTVASNLLSVTCTLAIAASMSVRASRCPKGFSISWRPAPAPSSLRPCGLAAGCPSSPGASTTDPPKAPTATATSGATSTPTSTAAPTSTTVASSSNSLAPCPSACGRGSGRVAPSDRSNAPRAPSPSHARPHDARREPPSPRRLRAHRRASTQPDPGRPSSSSIETRRSSASGRNLSTP